MKKETTPLYALFHVNRSTGEKVRYPLHSFRPMSKADAESSAQGSRIGAARGTAYPGEWETQAHPDQEGAIQFGTPEAAKDECLLAWLTTHSEGENMVTHVTYAGHLGDVIQAGAQAHLLDGRLIRVDHQSPNQGEPGIRFITVLRPS